MSAIRRFPKPQTSTTVQGRDGEPDRPTKPIVSLVVPAYNEASVLQQNMAELCVYLSGLENEYEWEILLVNDGSTDATGILAEEFAATRENVHILHHPTNFGIGQAFQFAFSQCRGDYVVVLDLDLSYSPEHIGKLLTKIRQSKARVVIASPYMEGGRVSNVPWHRRKLSVWANRFLSKVAQGKLTTLTGMVRVYDGRFLRTLTLRSMGMEINPEIIYKAKLLQARIEEIPAHLNWQSPADGAPRRRSSMRVLRHTLAIIMSGFIFRPFILFTLPGLFLLMFSAYVNSWMVIHFFDQYKNLPQYTWFLDRASNAVGAAYQQFPHTFVVGLLSLILAVQLIGLGIVSYQSKHYFEEVFYLGTNLYKFMKKETVTERE
jgi:glycosyltransferase involved in cell wall biosynthesis